MATSHRQIPLPARAAFRAATAGTDGRGRRRRRPDRLGPTVTITVAKGAARRQGEVS